MMRRRGKGRPLKGFANDSSSSDDENDGFTAISKKSSLKRPRISDIGGGINPTDFIGGGDDDTNDVTKANAPTNPTSAETSSNKRHHHLNTARQAKMDALLQELQSAKPSESTSGSAPGGDDHSSVLDGANYYHGHHAAPMKLGSYVEPGQEHLTTNIFVGNLDPMSTEEELTDAFRQFGEVF